MKEMTVDAVVENIDIVIDYVNEQLQKQECPMNVQRQIDIAIDELFGNIAHYAYGTQIGLATVCVETVCTETSDGGGGAVDVVITFIDQGVPFDPLAGADPDVTLSAEERDFGGLGIYMVRKSMDEVTYERKDGRNILRIRKRFRK